MVYIPPPPPPEMPPNRKIKDGSESALILYVVAVIILLCGTIGYILVKPHHDADIKCHESGGVMISTSKGKLCFRGLPYE